MVPGLHLLPDLANRCSAFKFVIQDNELGWFVPALQAGGRGREDQHESLEGAGGSPDLPSELLGTKFRALAQRRKGRDLSDLWLARRELRIVDGQLARAADYCLSAASVSPAVSMRQACLLEETPHARVAPESVEDRIHA